MSTAALAHFTATKERRDTSATLIARALATGTPADELTDQLRDFTALDAATIAALDAYVEARGIPNPAEE